MHANLYALGAIALWASLASLGVSLRHVPPFLLTGVALLVGSLLALPFVLKDRRQWRIPASTLLLGVYGLFGFHFLLFIALRHAPPVEANLVNYLWPLFMVVLAPLFLRGVTLRAVHVAAALLGFAGAAIAILGAGSGGSSGQGGGWSWGYLPALASAFIWASYSLLSQRVPAFPTAAIGLFGLVSGLLSLLCHWALEPSVAMSGRDWALIAVMGLGPLGAAFFLWDKALKLGDARQIGILSYLTPLGSTALLMLVSGRALSWSIGLAAAMIIGAAVLGTRTK
ncbi:MAG: DMT family transporter [Polaromonas sp.]|uniref:DMT family transporter n=1 Tax=Polaromonas sp. TaxID=1869339 RepID=UPI00273180B8|nr:DMT family transporter [Polaromonas sp.]MDP2449897.1 DMT family transporter [Polaromonas sp.]MDP3246229.1 DMT family transporter [Polaromonas sp.]MDP3757935.1 DMT family transporter [Polaromonas sp.]MDP3826183.1 DMT family transporter [Polaromonas sp.]